MKRIIFILSLLIILVKISKGQGINNLWMFGYYSWAGPPFGGVNINFASGSANISIVNRDMDFLFTNGVICDKNGNLLFSSNGRTISNAQDNTMLNGDSLNPGAFTSNYPWGLPIIQGNLIIPVPGDSTKYYLFHETCIYGANFTLPIELLYSLIDMNLDNGLGGVVFKNTILVQDTLEPGELTAVKHSNGRDWWVLFHKVDSDKFYKLLITPAGIIITSQNYGTYRNAAGGQSVFSPDGRKFAHYNFFSDVDIYDFDRCTGLLSNHLNIPINDSSNLGGIAISQNNNILYVSSKYYVYQFDLLAPNISATMQTVAVWDSFYSPSPPYATTFWLSQLAPDGKIYINCGNSTLDIHVINSPDSLGTACDLQQHGVHLGAFNAFTIANHPNYFLGAEAGSICDSLTSVKEITGNTIPIRLNPNPAQNHFYLNYTLPYGQTALATIFNALGEVVLQRNLYWYFGYLQIDCSGLGNGVYFVKVDAKGLSGSAKLVIAR